MILKKLLPLPAAFQHIRLRVRFRFQPLSSKCFRFHKNLTAFAAFTSLFEINLNCARTLLNLRPVDTVPYCRLLT